MKRFAASYFMQFVICIAANVLLALVGIHLTFWEWFFGSIPVGWLCWWVLGKFSTFNS